MADEEKLRYFLKKVTADLRETRRRLTEAEPSGWSRSRSSAWAAATPAASHRPEDLWRLVHAGGDAVDRIPARPRLGPRGALRRRPRAARHHLHPRGRLPPRRGRVRLRRSSASRRARRWRWTRSSGCCWRRPGRRWNGPGIDPRSLRGSPDRRLRRHERPGLHLAAPSWRPRTLRATSAPATRPAWCRAGCPTPSASRARRSRWTPRARRRWSRCTWRSRRCAAGSARWRWPAG